MKSLKYSLFILLFLLFIPFTVFADEQEHLSYTLNVSGKDYTFEYYSEDSNIPILFNEYTYGSSTYRVLKTEDDSYGFFTVYYNNSMVISHFGNDLYLYSPSSSLPAYLNSESHYILKVVFTPLRDLQVGESYSSDEFVGYNYISFSSSTNSYMSNVVSNNFGSTEDIVHVNATVLYYFDSSITTNKTFISYYRTSSSTTKIVDFIPSTGAFCDSTDSTNCIYPNIVSGEPFNVGIIFSHNSGTFTMSINGETLTVNRALSFKSRPYFHFYQSDESINVTDGYYISPSLSVSSYTISDDNGKYIKFYPSIIRTGISEYKSIMNWTASNNQNAYYYANEKSAGYYEYNKYYNNDSFNTYTLFYNKPLSGSSGGGSDPVEDFYKYIYPTKNNSFIRNYVQYMYAMFNARSKDNIGLYVTRYNKTLDSLNSYHLLFDSTINKTSSFSAEVNSEGIVSINMSPDLAVTNSITSIYDTSRYGGDSWTPANGGADFDLYQDSNNWWTYSTLYLDLNKTSIMSIIFRTNPFNNKHYTVTDLGLATTITFDTIVTNSTGVYDGKPIYFYTATVDHGEYIDYYVLLSLRYGDTTDIVNIYNCTPYQDLTKMTYYSSTEYLNMSIAYSELQAGGDDIQQPRGDYDITDSTIGKHQDMFENSLINESSADQLNAIDLFVTSVKDLIGYLGTYNTSLSDLLMDLELRSVDYDVYLNSFQDRDFVTSCDFFSEQLQWIYENTPFRVPIDIGLSTSVIMAVFF